MKVHLGCDHGGFSLKEALKKHLSSKGYDVSDEGAHRLDPQDDYVDFALKVAKKVGVAEGKALFQDKVRGILLCRSAAGMVIAANKVKGVRAVAAFDEESARHSREHNAANVLGLSGDWMEEKKALHLADVWLSTSFSNEERHSRRLRKIAGFEGL
ncbi:RpiB/LacA/LacB family sugar-phosphate isomerase [Candidatus Woesearchaeota archaeon]|nr:RpiB/LacA/LacB family sugar-phosphate isomerase [Candidatus Woesearchaeota archaeon]